MAWSNIGGGGGENVSAEVAVQTPLIQQIREAIVGKATLANATADKIVKGFSAYVGQELVNGTLDPETLKKGNYVWKELTAEGGTFRKYVVSDSESAYPDGGEKDGYWYERVVEGVAGVDFGTVTMASNRPSVTVEHDLGVVPSYVTIILKTPWFVESQDAIIMCGSSGYMTDSQVSAEQNRGSLDGTYYELTENSITFKRYNTYQSYYENFEYIWFAIA